MLKKVRFLLNFLVLVLFMFSLSPMTFAEENFSYNITNGEVTITRFGEGLKGDFAIPETVEGFPVTEISDNAFSYHKTEITTLNIPKTVKFLGDIYSPFQGFTTLEKITVDRENEFFVSDENGVLYTKDMKQLLHFPQNSPITDYAVHNGTETFLTGAFSGINNLRTVTIPASVIDVSGNDLYTGFYNCKNLEKIMVDSGNINYSSDENGALYNKEKTIMYYYPSGNVQKTFTVPGNVKNCYVGAFNFAIHLERVNMGNVTDVFNDVFVNCPNLQETRVSKSTKRFNADAFSNCANLKSIIYEGTEKGWKKIVYPENAESVNVICLTEETTVPETTTRKEEIPTTIAEPEKITGETLSDVKTSLPAEKEPTKTYKIIVVALAAVAAAITVVVFKNKKK